MKDFKSSDITDMKKLSADGQWGAGPRKTPRPSDLAGEVVTDGKVVCGVCPHKCQLAKGQVGLCGVKWSDGVKTQSTNYGRLTSTALDPIEKKPLAMFMPGTKVLSVGLYGCNMQCPFCQNWEISTARDGDVRADYMQPWRLASLALEMKAQGNIGVAYTYNEPLVTYRYVVDAAGLVRATGLKNVLVTNGCCTGEVAAQVIPLMDAINVDLKVFSADGYKKLGGDFDAVKAFISMAVADPGVHLELTTLIVPGLNDSAEMMEAEASWIASLDPDIPLHVTRFFPRHKMLSAEPTDLGLLHELAHVASRHLSNVFLGNC